MSTHRPPPRVENPELEERIRLADHVRSKESRMVYFAAVAAAGRIIGVHLRRFGKVGEPPDPAAVAEVVEAFEMLDPRWRTKAFWLLDSEQDFTSEWADNHWKLRAVRNMPGSGLFDVIGPSR